MSDHALVRRALLVAVTVSTVAGCAAIPDRGAVHVGRPVSAPGGLGDIDVRVLPPAAQPGLAPSDVVHGFLRALVSPDGNYDIARTYLTNHAASTWRPGTGVTTYDDSSVQTSTTESGVTTRTLQLRAPRLGDIDARGNFAPSGGTITASFGLVRQNNQWRIDRLRDGVLLSALDVQRAFRPAVVYYLNRSGTELVPEQVFLRPVPGVTTALVRALVDGPGPWLAPSVRTGFPSSTGLLGNVPVDPTGVAEVNLSSSVRQATPAELRALSAQLVWTLRQVSDVSLIRVVADGSPLAIRGVPTNQPATSWPDLAPGASSPVNVAAYSTRGRWQAVGGRGVLAAAAGLSDLTIADDGARIAGVAAGQGAATLRVGTRGGRLTPRLTARSLHGASFDAAGNVYVIAQRSEGQQVMVVSPAGQVQVVGTDHVLDETPVQAIRVSHDGARVAAVVGSVGHGRLYVGRVVVSHGTTSFGAFRNVLPGAHDVRGVAWDGGDQILTTLADATGGRELVAVDVDGYATRTIPTTGLSGQPVDVAVTPGRPILVTAAGAVWRSESSGAWARLGSGDQPVYPS
jgi:hypothetical protein